MESQGHKAGETQHAAKRSRYSDREKARALVLAEAFSVPRAAAATGIPAKTIEGWRSGRGLHPDTLQLAGQEKARLGAEYRKIADECAGLQLALLEEIRVLCRTGGLELAAVLAALRQVTGTGQIATDKAIFLAESSPETERKSARMALLEMLRPTPQPDVVSR